MSMFVAISVGSMVGSLAYLSGRLVWNILAECFWDWFTFFNRYFEWNLS